MKRRLSLILAMLVLASTVISCSDAANDDNANNIPSVSNADSEQAAEETEPSYLDTLEKKDFEGAEYTLIVTLQGNGLLHPAAAEMDGETINDAYYMRDRAIEEAYNVSIKYPEYADSPNTAIAVVDSVMAGDAICDAYIDPLSDGANYMGKTFQSRVLYNLLDVPYLKPDKEWWSILMYEKLQVKGKLFFTSGDMTGYSFAAPSCAFMNLKVAADNSIDENDIYNLVYDGKWTLDEMMARTEGLRNDINGDGKITPEEDSYGVVNATISLTSTELLVGAGVEMCGIDDEGDIKIDLNNERVLGAIEKVKKCFTEISNSDNTSVLLKDCFCGDRTLFCMHFVESAANYRDMKSDFAILPMPKYDEMQKSYMSYINPHTHSFVAMPLILEDEERAGYITEVMEYMSVRDVRPCIYDVTLKEKIARNPDTQAMLDIIFDTTYTDFNAILNIGSTIDVLNKAVFFDGDFASLYAKTEKATSRTLDTVMKLFEDAGN